MNIPHTIFHSNSHAFKSFWVLLYLMVSAGVGSMFVVTMLTTHLALAMAALLLPMFLVLGFFAGKTEYVMDGNSLEKHLTTFLRGRKVDKRYNWAQVKSFKTGSDLSRSMEEYNFLEINFAGGDTWQLTDQGNKAEFENFKQVFLAAIDIYNSQKAESPEASAHHHSSTLNKIEQEKTFYETTWAKVFFWHMALFVSMVMGFLYLNPQYGGAITTFRLSFVILPGMA
jgi:hypothetical protein